MSLWLNFAHKAGTCSLAAMSRRFVTQRSGFRKRPMNKGGGFLQKLWCCIRFPGELNKEYDGANPDSYPQNAREI